ncbi:MAG: glycosyltransferase family 2 protein [Thermodesulfobacteriota bacterium]|nr:glycosyltransferase family 2 protein [Thermodesulfobacteriota bacterium]
MFKFFIVLYLLTLFLPLCTYALYPLALWIVGKLFPFRPHRRQIMPKVSIIIPAYNEAKAIERKIQNTLALQYPKDRLEILVGSDGSTDETPALMRKFAPFGVRSIDFHKNRGKTAVQNDLVKQSKGEILVFTDAASFLEADALKRLLRNFADERVGCVAGRVRFVNTDMNITSQSQGLYWRYEVKIRDMESKLGSLIGVDGPLYGVRRDCYVPLKTNVISDLLTPLLVLEKGKKAVWEPEANVTEYPTTTTSDEFSTRRRITVRGLVGISLYGRLLNPLRHPFMSLQLFLHKVLRWFVGPILILNILATCILSGHWLFSSMLLLYLLFFLSATLGWFAEHRGIKAGVLTVPYYFTLVNLAATMGIVDFFAKREVVAWEPVRHP